MRNSRLIGATEIGIRPIIEGGRRGGIRESLEDT